MKKEQVLETLQGHGFVLTEEKIVKNGVQLIFSNGVMVTVYHRTGNVNPQGKHMDYVGALLNWVPSKKRRAVNADKSPDDCF